jgi:hypothetical protein
MSASIIRGMNGSIIRDPMAAIERDTNAQRHRLPES